MASSNRQSTEGLELAQVVASSSSDVKDFQPRDSGSCTISVEEAESGPRISEFQSPRKWSKPRKWFTTLILSLASLVVTLGSSITSPAIFNIGLYFGVDRLVAILSLSLYILGVSFGPLLWGPLSEIYGRNAIMLPTWSVFVTIQIMAALARNIETHLLARTIAGIFGSSALSVGGGYLADLFTEDELGPPLGIFSLCAFLGPVLGPISGGYLTQKAPGGLLESWRWTMWFLLMVSGAVGISFIWLPETYEPTLVRRLNKSAQNPVHAESVKGKLRVTMSRPFKLLVLDPIVLLMSLYMAVIYGILYIYFGAYPVIFGFRYHFKPGPIGLTYLGVGAGVVLSIPSTLYANRLYAQLREKYVASGGSGRFPEARLPMTMAAALLAPAGVFWFAWTGKASIHWIVPVLSGVPFGWSLVTLFATLMTYLGDSYHELSASCIAAATVVRSLFAFGFPLFMPDMYTNLKPEWAGTLIGFLLVLFAPVPFLFWKYGERIRAKSRFTLK